MSIETWKKEFYPVPASHCPANSKDATEHCLRKWRGLRQANLTKHGLVVGPTGHVRGEADEVCFLIGRSTCAYCLLYHSEMAGCSICPGYRANGRRCDSRFGDPMGVGAGEGKTPWNLWVQGDVSSISHDPEPMIKWLERAQRWVRRGRLQGILPTFFLRFLRFLHWNWRL